MTESLSWDARRRLRRNPVGGTTALVVALTSFATACGPGEMPAPPPPTVTVETPIRRDVPLYGLFTGNTRALASAQIRARVTGLLEEMYFEPSTLVEEGQTLFLIEPDQYEAVRDEAQAALNSARAEADRTAADLDRLELALETDAVSESEVDRARALRDQALASVASAEATLRRARFDLDNTRVTTPIAGQVSRNLVDLGNLVSAQEATLLTTVNMIDPIHVYFDVPESAVLEFLQRANQGIVTEEPVAAPEPRPRDLPDSAPLDLEGQEELGGVEIATELDEGFPHTGYLDYIDNTVNPATGTIQLRAVIRNESFALFPGLFVRVRVRAGTQEDALLVREVGIDRDLGGSYVLVVGDDGMVERRYVTLGAVQEDGYVLVQEGLDGSERYITNGLLRARPGLPVTPEEPGEGDAAADPGAGA